MSALTIRDFEKQPRRAYLFDRWAAQRQIPTVLGPFGIYLAILGKDDTNPPDDEMLIRVSDLIDFIESHDEEVLDVVYGHYLFTARSPGWLESCGVPRGLGRADVSAFLDQRLLGVSRHLNWAEPYTSGVLVDPLWDTEHKLRLVIRNGSIATVNDMMFRLESQVLRWVRP